MVAQMCFQNFGKEPQPGDPRVGHQTQNLWNFWRPRLVAVSGWPCGSSETYFFNCSAETYRNFETPHNWKKMQCLRVLPLILWPILINQYAVSLIFFWCCFRVQWLPQQFHKCTIHPVGGSTKEESDQRVCLILLFSIWGLIAFGVVDSSRHAGWSDYQSQMEPGQNFSICQDSISKYCTSWLADNVDWTLLGFAVLLKLKRRNLLLAYQALGGPRACQAQAHCLLLQTSPDACCATWPQIRTLHCIRQWWVLTLAALWIAGCPCKPFLDGGYGIIA